MFKKARCFYCNNWTPRPRNVSRLREFQCQVCTAVNYLDKTNGDITEPPVPAQQSSSSNVRYGHAPSQRSTSPASSRLTSRSNVFCQTCLTNQHFRTENLKELDAVSKDEDQAKWREQQAYIEALEKRYPQVCPQCRPKAREVIKHSNYLSRASNMIVSMQKTKRGEYAPVTEGRLWRSALLYFGQAGREVSVAGQTIWHLLGARMVPLNGQTPGFDDHPPANSDSVAATIVSCSMQTWAAEHVNPQCFFNLTDWMMLVLFSAVATIWWNNKLRAKYLDRKPGRMVGITDYYMLQLLGICTRAVGWWLLQDPQRLASKAGYALPTADWIYRGAHLVMIAFIGFTELLSRRLVKLENKYHVTTQRDEDILPETPAVNRQRAQASQTQKSSNVPPWMLQSSPQRFTLSTLSSKVNAQGDSHQLTMDLGALPRQPISSTLRTQINDTGENMDWSPTQPSSVQPSSSAANYNLRSRHHGSNDSRSNPPSFQKSVSVTSQARVQKPREAPNHFTKSMRSPTFGPDPTPHIEPSFLSHNRYKRISLSDSTSKVDEGEGKGEGRRVEEDSASDRGSTWGETRNPKHSDFSMAPPKLWLNQDKMDTGLEGIFDEVFTLKDTHKEPREPRGGSNEAPSTGHGAMFGNQYTDMDESVTDRQATLAKGWGVILGVVVCVTSMALAVITGLPIRI